jgi:hypothetical protein
MATDATSGTMNLSAANASGGVQYSTPMPANTVPVPAPYGGTMSDLLNPAAAAQYAVNVAGMTEAITQPFYSYQAYPAAGTGGTLNFFAAVPGTPGTTFTLEDTNMQAANAFPAPTTYLLQGIGVDYLPGIAASRFGAESANGQLNDFYAIMRRGFLVLTIANKPYLQFSTMLGLPPRAHVNGFAAVADATTPATALQTMVQIGYSDGPVFCPRPLLVPSMQNFNVTISYPGGAVAIPSSDAAARIGVWIYGTQYRPVQ